MLIFNIEKLWEDDDGMLQVELSISNGSTSAVQDIYVYPDEILNFGDNLKEFPRKVGDIVTLEYGSTDPKVYSQIRIRAFTYNKAGQTALEVLTDNHKDPPDSAKSHFYVRCEPITLNDLGMNLCQWVTSKKENLKFSRET